MESVPPWKRLDFFNVVVGESQVASVIFITVQSLVEMVSQYAVYTMNYTVSQANGRERTGKAKFQK